MSNCQIVDYQIKIFYVADKMDKKIHQAASKCLEKTMKTVNN